MVGREVGDCVGSPVGELVGSTLLLGLCDGACDKLGALVTVGTCVVCSKKKSS